MKTKLSIKRYTCSRFSKNPKLVVDTIAELNEKPLPDINVLNIGLDVYDTAIANTPTSQQRDIVVMLMIKLGQCLAEKNHL